MRGQRDRTMMYFSSYTPVPCHNKSITEGFKLMNFYTIPFSLSIIVVGLLTSCSRQDEPLPPPNILWITSEDNSPYLGCYGDGGAIITNNNDLARKMRMIANHGQAEKYYHDIIGINSRLDTVQAAILNIKLKYLNDYTKARQQAAAFYDDALIAIPALTIPARNPNSTHVFHQYTLKIENGKRNELQAYLKEKGIPTMIYYPLPVHLQKAYQYLGYKKGDFPVAEELCEKVLSLPMHTELSFDQLEYITENVKRFFK